MKLKNLYIIAGVLSVMAVTPGMQSCVETESDLVSFVEDNRLKTPNDTIYSLMGIISKMQVVADRTVLLGELRGDLTVVTEDASLDLQHLANFTAGTDNPYNNARDYYAIIQNCNYFLANADTTLAKRGYKVFDKEYAVVKAYRAWTYLQLAINYGSVPFFTEPILAEKDAEPSKYPFYNVQQIAEYFIKDLAPYTDTDYPSYGSINGVNSRKFYIPVRVLLGDLCLWAGEGYYAQAAKYYHDFLTLQGNVHPTSNSAVSWENYEFDSVYDNYASVFRDMTSEVLTIIPMEEDEYDGIISRLTDVFNSTTENNYFYQATHSPAYDELSAQQRYVLVYGDPVTLLPDTVSPPDEFTYTSENLRGDLRLSSVYSLRNVPQASTTLSPFQQTCYKYRSENVTLYRLQHVYLRFAEALNRAGYPQAAFAVLKYGLWKDNIEKYISEEERAAAGSLLSFSEYYFTRDNTLGIHSRGCGQADADTLYVIPELPSLSDSILFVENKICDEMALETAAEGLRFYDLMRLSMHRNDPTFLADKVARRKGSANRDENLFTLLSDEKNWYLPLQ